MKTKFLILTTILAIGCLLSACGPSSINVQTQTLQRTITVSGTGEITLSPDIAYIDIGVQSQDANATDAMSDNNTKAQAIVDAIKEAGVAEKDIQTTNFSITPQEQYDTDGKMTGIIYVVDNTVYVTVRDLTKLGNLLDASVRAGANNINSISFDLADKTDALSQARQAAVKNARQQADELVAATGVTLGDVQTITYYDNTSPVTIQYSRVDKVSSNSVPIQTGSLQISTTVTIIYQIK
jgi:uncharacterized protein